MTKAITNMTLTALTDDYKDEIIALVKVLNTSTNNDVIMSKVYGLLHAIFRDNNNNENELLSILYRLIFRAFQTNPTNAYCILTGFVQFGQSRSGKKVKPFLDHLLIEAIDELLILGGWSILKKCLNTLRDNVDIIINEPVFSHILTRVIKQLDEDATILDTNNISELCCCLPRERSFEWGWFSYYVAHAFYAGLNARRENVQQKTLRKYLKYYRKMITRLRRIIYNFDPEVYQSYYTNTGLIDDETSISETWEEILNELSDPEYAWTFHLFNNKSSLEDIISASTSNSTSTSNSVSTDDSFPPLDDELVIVSSPQEVHAYAEAEKEAVIEKGKLYMIEEEKESTEQVQVQAPTMQASTAEGQQASTATQGWFSWLSWS